MTSSHGPVEGPSSSPAPTDVPADGSLLPRAVASLTDDAVRVSAAARLLVGSGGNPALDRLAGLVARLLDMPSSQVSLLSTHQTVAAGAGMPEGAVGSTGPLDESLCTVTASLGGPLVVDDATGDERVADLPSVTSGAVGAYLGVPLLVAGGSAVGALCVYGPDPRPWSAYDIALLEQLAGSVMAELELSALSAEFESSRQRWDLAIDAAGIGSFDWDLATDVVEWDERMQALFGYRPGEFVPNITEAFSRIHPDDRARLDAAIAAAIESCDTFGAEYRIVLPDGRHRWVAVRGRATPGPDGQAARVLGTAYDVTDARSSHDRAAHLLETMATGFLSVDHDWRVTYVNAMGSRVLGYTSAQLLGKVVWDAFPGARESEFGQQYLHAMSTGEEVELEAYYDHLDRWFAVRAIPSAEGLALYFLDITERRADREQALAAAARLELLSTVSAALAAAALDLDDAAARLAELVLPALADWSVVSLVGDEGRIRDVGSAHADPARRPATELFAKHRLDGIDQTGPAWNLLRAAGSGPGNHDVVAATIPMLHSAEAAEALENLAPSASLMLPLVSKGRVIGALTLFRDTGRPPFTNDEVITAREIAARAGLALDNARLYAQQRSLAEGLQHSLLTEPPEPDHCEIVVRYLPAARIASVGGDWFDSFLQRGGATMLVIGDVVGHDTEAAAAMGQVRGLLRGIAWHSGAGPAEVLSGVDAAIEGLAVRTMATAVVARLEQTPEELAEGVTRLRWSNAGHPPPMVIGDDGVCRSVGDTAPDLLLGIDPATARSEHEVALGRGATVVLYTDGLVERRDQPLDVGLETLRQTLDELADLTLTELCDELLVRMGRHGDDDIALLAVRLHRQDQPRPPEAGPEVLPSDVPDRL